MITVAHEALIDLIVDADGQVDPRLGGAGFNVTRAVARLGWPVAYLGRLSGDRFGQLIRANLDQHGVKIAVEAPSAAPTTERGQVRVPRAGIDKRPLEVRPGKVRVSRRCGEGANIDQMCRAFSREQPEKFLERSGRVTNR